MFPNIGANDKNRVRWNERAISVAKNIDVNDLNMKIQSQIASQLHSFKSIDAY